MHVTKQLDSPFSEKEGEVMASSFQIHDCHDDLISLKLKLNWIGYGGIKVTKYFGSYTENKVKDFQSDNDLPVTGIIDNYTRIKLKEAFSSLTTNKQGGKHNRIKNLKRDLNRIGFRGILVTPKFGSFTEMRVKEFQSRYGLAVTGEVNIETLMKINQIVTSPIQLGIRHKDVIVLKKKLNRLGYGRILITNKFGKLSERRLKKFQKDHELPVSGIADELTLAKIDQALKIRIRKTYINYDITLEEALDIHMKSSSQDNIYKQYAHSDWIKYDDKQKEYHVTANSLNIRGGPGTNYAIIDTFTKGRKVSVIGKQGNWYIIGLDKIKRRVVKTYLDPNSFLNNKKHVFQFLDLTRPNVVNVAVLNKYLNDKGVLKDQGQAFIKAGNENGICELLLVLDVILKTSNGSSPLANGIPVDKDGRITYIHRMRKGKKIKVPGKTSATERKVYNMYTTDSLIEGAKKAFNKGWFTPKEAIIGAAKDIKVKYIRSGKSTFYKIKWDPDHLIENGTARKHHTDNANWVLKKIDAIYKLYQELDSYILYLNIPVYKDNPIIEDRPNHYHI